MRSREEVVLVEELIAAGLNDCAIARRTGIPRATIRMWRTGQVPDFARRTGACAVCSGTTPTLPHRAYSYLLGLYLGDGCLAAATASAGPGRRTSGYWDVYSFSKHWPCLFPQHGPGRKHERKIELTVWQRELVDQDRGR